MDVVKKYLLYAKLQKHKNKVKEAKEIIEKAKEISNFYVAFSGGKDSTAANYLANSFPLILFHDEILLPETEEYIKKIKNLTIIAGPSYHCEFFTSWGDRKPPENSGIIWEPDLQGKTDEIMMNKYGYSGVILGLRKEENARRRFLLGKKGGLFQKKNGMWYCNPLFNWSVEDVWAYIYSNNIVYNAAYDKLRALGAKEKECRIGPLFVGNVLGLGQLVWLKNGWPELFYELAERFPEITSYA